MPNTTKDSLPRSSGDCFVFFCHVFFLLWGHLGFYAAGCEAKEKHNPCRGNLKAKGEGWAKGSYYEAEAGEVYSQQSSDLGDLERLYYLVGFTLEFFFFEF